MKSLTRMTVISLVGLALVVTFSFIGQNHASALFSGATDQACSGVNLSDSTTTCADTSGSISSLVSTFLDILSWIIGVVAIIMVIIGGFRYVISGGDSAATSSARNTILYALVGLVIVAIAQVLVHFVFTKTVKATSMSPIALLSLRHLFIS